MTLYEKSRSKILAQRQVPSSILAVWKKAVPIIRSRFQREYDKTVAEQQLETLDQELVDAGKIYDSERPLDTPPSTFFHLRWREWHESIDRLRPHLRAYMDKQKAAAVFRFLDHLRTDVERSCLPFKLLLTSEAKSHIAQNLLCLGWTDKAEYAELLASLYQITPWQEDALLPIKVNVMHLFGESTTDQKEQYLYQLHEDIVRVTQSVQAIDADWQVDPCSEPFIDLNWLQDYFVDFRDDDHDKEAMAKWTAEYIHWFKAELIALSVDDWFKDVHISESAHWQLWMVRSFKVEALKNKCSRELWPERAIRQVEKASTVVDTDEQQEYALGIGISALFNIATKKDDSQRTASFVPVPIPKPVLELWKVVIPRIRERFDGAYRFSRYKYDFLEFDDQMARLCRSYDEERLRRSGKRSFASYAIPWREWHIYIDQIKSAFKIWSPEDLDSAQEIGLLEHVEKLRTMVEPVGVPLKLMLPYEYKRMLLSTLNKADRSTKFSELRRALEFTTPWEEEYLKPLELALDQMLMQKTANIYERSALWEKHEALLTETRGKVENSRTTWEGEEYGQLLPMFLEAHDKYSRRVKVIGRQNAYLNGLITARELI